RVLAAACCALATVAATSRITAAARVGTTRAHRAWRCFEPVIAHFIDGCGAAPVSNRANDNETLSSPKERAMRSVLSHDNRFVVEKVAQCSSAECLLHVSKYGA